MAARQASGHGRSSWQRLRTRAASPCRPQASRAVARVGRQPAATTNLGGSPRARAHLAARHRLRRLLGGEELQQALQAGGDVALEVLDECRVLGRAAARRGLLNWGCTGARCLTWAQRRAAGRAGDLCVHQPHRAAAGSAQLPERPPLHRPAPAPRPLPKQAICRARMEAWMEGWVRAVRGQQEKQRASTPPQHSTHAQSGNCGFLQCRHKCVR